MNETHSANNGMNPIVSLSGHSGLCRALAFIGLGRKEVDVEFR